MIKQFDLTPRQGIGPIQRGMSRDRVRSLMGCTHEEFFKSPFAAFPTDSFDDVIHVYYDHDEQVVGVELFSPSQVSYKDLDLLSASISEIKKHMVRWGFAVEPVEAGYEIPALGVVLYAAEDSNDMARAEAAYVALADAK